MSRTRKNRFITKPLVAAAAALTITVPATADDTEVFNAILAAQNKPNILFVLDYSGSMDDDVYNQDIPDTDTTTQSKFEVLNEAVNTLMQDNAGKINVGIGSLYRDRASGVRWPISDLEADASTIDADIDPNTVTVADVIEKQLSRNGPWGSTPTVNALAEAAAYFRGDPVLHNDYDVNEVWRHQPDRWDNATQEYTFGNSNTAMPSSYTPSDAYKFNVPNGGYGYCTDYVGGTQGCEGKVTYDCNFREGGTGTWEATVDSDGGTWTSSDRNVCKYEHEDSWVTPNYVSPLTQSCQANFIVLISDGQPTTLQNTQTMQTVLSATPAGDISGCDDLSTTVFGTATTNQSDGNCGPEILDYLASNDINPAIEGSNVRTYTVGFSLDGSGKNYLRLLAEKGQGEFYEATQPAELSEALDDLLDSILAGSQNFAELSIDVNPDTFSHDNRTYFSLFSPSSYDSWEGNLKGFFIDDNGLLDVKGEPATFNDGSGLKFVETSQSFWSSTPDGNDVMSGGASESITSLPVAPNTRNVFTYLGGNPILSASDDNRLEKANGLINDALLNNPGAGVRDLALDWLANAPMGDPLHTKPLVINYGARKVVYTMTNQGLLHAFDATSPTIANSAAPDLSGGEELFAFMPKELLKNIPSLYAPERTMSHIYGLDGSMTRWHDDNNKDGIVNGGDTIMLVLGMRRGGTSYYALDVTNPEQPVFKWQKSPTDPGFSRLAQTWSRASLVTVNQSGNDTRVLVFGGGYDADQVDGKRSPTKSNGNAVYMVDKGGNLVWSIDETDNAAMEYSIASDLTVIDSDNNGRVDRLYFGDQGGQMWRVDLDDIAVASQTHVTKFADITQGLDHQPIFYPPSVSMNKERGERFLAVAFGTGDRTNPLNKSSNNAFYMLRDTDYEVGPPDSGTFSTITPNKIADLTENPIGSTDENVRDAAIQDLKDKRGWAVFLNTSEKSLSKVVTFEGKFLATTFEPTNALDSSGNPDPCQFGMVGRLYVMNLLDARPIEILSDGSETKTESDKSKRITLLNGTTIPSAPVIIFPADSSKVQVVVDKEAVTTVNRKIRTIFWHAK